MTTTRPPTGIVLDYHSNFYTVKVGAVRYQCFLKGLLKKDGADVLVGDCVVLDSVDDTNQSARIVQVLPRNNQLTRPKIANITKAMVVAAIQSPPLDCLQLDRYVTHVLIAGVEPVICISKIDLAEDPTAIEAVRAIYAPLGIAVHATTIQRPETVNAAFAALQGETVVLAGLSGAGKSSLLNTYQPGLGLAVQGVSQKVQRGQHTTRHVSLIQLDTETYVADTPGFSYLKFDTDSPQAIEAAFPDFAPYRTHCRFHNCLHLEESDCAVIENRAHIAPSRYASYVAFQEEAKAYVEALQTTSQKQEYGYKTLKKGKQEELAIPKLAEKHRQTSRRKLRQEAADWLPDEETDLPD